MISNICFCCDVPGCQSNITIHPTDAKDGPESALARAGWQVTGAECDGVKTVTQCLCPAHRVDDHAPSVPEDD